MDNIELITILSDYAIFCLDRQNDVLKAYRKIRRERWDFVGIILGIVVCVAAIMASIWCAVADIIDGWVPAVIIGPAGAFIGMLIITAKTPLDNIHEAKTFIVKASSIPAALEDVAYIVEQLDTSNDNTEEEEQCYLH